MRYYARNLRFRRRGFTLVELMISIAIVLLLVAGINLIFQTTSKAVGAGQALSEGARNNQAAQTVMYQDFSSAVTDDSAPYLIICNHAIPAFRTLADQQGDRDYNATAAANTRWQKMLTIDLNNNNIEGEAASASPGEIIDPTTYNDRNHRTDMISFFARGAFKRQTGNPGTYVADESATEAMIWYGHTYIPNNNGAFSGGDTLPGAGTFGGNDNPNNFFATQWVVGRQAILLNGNPGVAPKDSANVSQNYFQTNTAGAADLTPLLVNNAAKLLVADDTSGFSSMQYSRYDISDTSTALFKKRIIALLDATPGAQWWTQLMGGANVNRYACNPFVSRPVGSADFAKTSPIFLSGCSQFIVEFAGDYVTQDDTNVNGTITAGTPDTKLDYVVDATTGAHKIRWYGMPRNVDTTDDTLAAPVISGVANSHSSDVVPVFAITGATQPFEHTTTLAASPNFVGAVQPNAEYVCAWGPQEASSRPWMIRITYSLDDPASRLGNPLTYEYVFKLR